MSQTPRRASSPRRSWKEQRSKAPAAPEARRVKQVLLTLVGAALVGALAWLYWGLFTPRREVHLACLAVGDYDTLNAPPIAFAQENVDGLRKLAELPHMTVTVFDQLTEQRTIAASLGAQLRALVENPDDVLIFYVCAHGVSDQGTAYLLCSDYEPSGGQRREQPSGRYQLADLLEEIKPVKAKAKLLVLDTGPLHADPRLGMVVNEFALLLEEAVRNHAGDPALWVLASHDLTQRSHVSHARKWGVFSHFVAEGLRGAADADSDDNRDVDLDELFHYVRGHVAGWVWQASGQTETQTPLLVKAGEGRRERGDDRLVLTRARAPSDTSDEGQPRAAPPQAAHKAKTAPRGSPRASRQKKAPAAAAGSTPPRRVRGFERLLLDEWRRRDSLDNPQTGQGWTPADYAPHLWRRHQELLLGYEAQSRAGAAAEPPAAELLESNIRRLEGLRQEVTDRRRDFDRGAARRSYEQHPQIAEAVRLRNDLLFRVPHYVRFYGRARSVADAEFHRHLSGILDGLDEFLALFTEPPSPTGTGRPEGPAEEEWLETLGDQRRHLEGLQAAMDDHLRTKATALARAPQVRGASYRIDELLATPLLTAQERRALLAARRAQAGVAGLEQAAANPVGSPGEGASPLETSTLAEAAWQRVLESAELELKLVRLSYGDPAHDNIRALEEYLDLARAPSGPRLRPASSVAPRLLAYRKFGALLASMYRDLPAQIEDRLAADDDAERRATEHMLRLAEGRDALEVDRRIQRALEDARGFNPLADVPLPELGLAEGSLAGGAGAGAPAEPSDPVDARSVELVVEGRPGTWESTLDQERRKITLLPFPAGQTEYALLLRNPAGKQKKVQYRLMALRAPEPGVERGWQWPWDEHDELVPGCELLVEGPLEVEAGDARRVPLVPQPIVPSAPPQAGGSQTTVQPPDQAQPETTVSIAGGLVFVVDDPADPAAKRRQMTWIDVVPRHPAEYLLEPEVWYDRHEKKVWITVQPKDARLLPPGGSQVVWELEDPILIGAQSKVQDLLEPAAGSVTLFAHVEPERNRTVRVLLTVDGYPRAFVYDVRCDGPAERAPRKLLSLSDLDIVRPLEGEPFRGVPPLPVELRVDAPPAAFQDRGGYSVRVGIAGDEDARYFFADRAVQVRWLKADAPGTLAVDTEVTNLKVDLNSEAYPNQAVQVSAQLLRGNEVLAHAERRVKLDGLPPEIRLRGGAFAAVRAEQGSDLELALEVHDAGAGVKKVEFAVDKDNSGELKEPQTATVSADADDVYRMVLSTKDLSLGSHTVLVQATDHVDQAARARLTVKVVERTTTRSGNAGGKPNNKLSVVATYGKRPARGIKLTLEGAKTQTATTDDKGRFVFTDLPPGPYKLTAKGIAQNKERQSETEVMVEPLPAPPASIAIELE